jgi:nitrogen fixation NifU-like protein
MFDLKALYQEVIIDHNRHPQNFHKLDDATAVAEGFNPLCGDRLTVYIKREDDKIADVSFEGSGCAISVASASLMTEHLKGKTAGEAREVFERFHAMVTHDTEQEPSDLGKLGALAGVRAYPSRIKCATLCWHTLNSALHGDHETVSTE